MKFTGFAAGIAGAAIIAGAVVDTPALAQGVEEIVVTARKREEKLQEIPLSITAFSSADIERKGFKGLEDIALAAPGVQYSNQGGQIPGRYTSAIRFRGMNVNSDSPSLQLGALFIDGIYVFGGTQSVPVDNLERIEVIKGPQSAYFGRNTFGGAINYITKDPSLTEYKGKVSVSAATYNEFDVSASHEGPIVQDRLAYRVGARLYSKGAMWRASDGGALGEESSKSVDGILYAHPSDNVKVKLHGFYDKDDDGPAAGGIIEGFANDSCTGKTINTQDPAFPVSSPKNYVCGAVPKQGIAKTAFGTTRIIDSNTSLFPQQLAKDGLPNFLVDKLVNGPNPPQIGNVPFIDHMGLVRDVLRFSGMIDVDFAGGYTGTIQGGYNRLRANWIRDFGLSPVENWYSRDPQYATDYSLEGRIASPQDQRLTWIAGANYYHQRFIQSGSGGDAISICTPILAAPPPGESCTRVPFFTANSLLQNTDTINAWGIFASINYRIIDTVTATFEGRYQYNKAGTGILTTAPLYDIDKDFLPRAILKWQPTPQTNVYFSYAKGVIQGQPNSQVATATPRELAQYQAQVPGISASLPAEILNMYELGWKQSLMDNRITFDAAGYYGKWTGSKGRGVVLVQEDCGSVSHGGVAGATAAQGCPNGATGLPALNPNGTPYLNSRNVNTPGDVKLHGIEFEGSAILTEGWDAHLNVTWAKSKYTNFLFNFVQPIAGYSQMKGNSTARFPIWSGAFSTQYTHDLNGTWQWFVNGDAIYVGKTYVDESNLAYCKPYWTVNTRAGVTKPGFRVELFVKNLLNDDSWSACARWTDFDHAPSLAQLTVFQGIAVSQNNKRQFGVRSSIEF